MSKSLVFGGKYTALLASFSQSDDSQSWCWRTSQTSFEWADPTLLEVLPQSGMTSSGRLYPLHNVEHPTSDADGLALPTPCHRDYKNNPLTPSRHTGKHSRCLNTAVGEMLLPTPTVNESKNTLSGASQWARHDSLNVEAAKLRGLDKTTGKDFRLNPLFVEEMMGFPIGWTELKPLETQSSHSVQSGSDNKS